MKNSFWKIEYECPQCGAPVVLDEDQNVLSCGYCRVRHIHLTEGRDTLSIPQRTLPDEKVLFVPYWRFMGTAFTLEPRKISSRIVDSTSRAVSLNVVPYSLGLRPQVQNLKPVTPETPGLFLPPAIPLEDVVNGVKQRSFVSLGSEPKSTAGKDESDLFSALFRASSDAEGAKRRMLGDALSALSGARHNNGGTETTYLGEVTSLIYSPAVVRGGVLFDGLNGKKLGLLSSEQESVIDTAKPGAGKPLRFLAAICPNCGGDMEGHANTTVFTCGSCVSAWKRSPTGLDRMSCSIVPQTGGDNHVYLPFWRIRPKVSGLKLETYWDLAVHANIPRLHQQAWGERELFLTVPAFRLPPALFATFSRRATLLEREPEPINGFNGFRLYPADMPITAVSSWLKTIIYDLARPKHAIFPRLHEIMVEPLSTSLVYLPFEWRGNELIERSMSMRIGINGLLRSFFYPSSP